LEHVKLNFLKPKLGFNFHSSPNANEVQRVRNVVRPLSRSSVELARKLVAN
jgi:hypothetical protein